MNNPFNRRDFLKIIGLLSSSLYLSGHSNLHARSFAPKGTKNILVIVFDTLSAKHISLYGYERETMPNLSRIAERATVYHNHYSGGVWTTPGTGSILTGTLPWTHRAFSLGEAVIEGLEKHNIFNLFDSHFRIAYSHNPNLTKFFRQFGPDIDLLENLKDLYLKNNLSFDRFFSNDDDIASLTWERIVDPGEKKYRYSPLYGPIYEAYTQNLIQKLKKQFPRGIPNFGDTGYFILEDGINWMLSELTQIRQPFLGYFHYLPPHHPYDTRKEFVNFFKNDGFIPKSNKPDNPYFNDADKKDVKIKSDLAKSNYVNSEIQKYDEYILYADSELGRLFDVLEGKGLLDNTLLVFTSDHGELFERGFSGHKHPVMYESVVRTPLIIVDPDQKIRRDVTENTSAIDILPTLLKITGKPIPKWIEGQVLPLYADTTPNPNRSIYALEATNSKKDKPLGPATAMLVKGKYKLTYYFGYKELINVGTYFELYDLENDPEELSNIYQENSLISQQLRKELVEKIIEVDKPFQ